MQYQTGRAFVTNIKICARPPQDVVQERSVNWGWNPVGQQYNFGLTPNPLASTGSVGTVTVVIT